MTHRPNPKRAVEYLQYTIAMMTTPVNNNPSYVDTPPPAGAPSAAPRSRDTDGLSIVAIVLALLGIVLTTLPTLFLSVLDPAAYGNALNMATIAQAALLIAALILGIIAAIRRRGRDRLLAGIAIGMATIDLLGVLVWTMAATLSAISSAV